MSKTELNAKIKELKELKIMADELAAEITAIEDIIKAEMLQSNTDTLITGEYKVRYSTVKSSRFDSKAFKATHSELYNQYTKTVEFRRLTVN